MASYSVISFYRDKNDNGNIGRNELKIPGKLTSAKIKEAEKILQEHYDVKELIIFNLIKLRRTISEQQE